jgi:hypothetical protein
MWIGLRLSATSHGSHQADNTLPGILPHGFGFIYAYQNDPQRGPALVAT